MVYKSPATGCIYDKTYRLVTLFCTSFYCFDITCQLVVPVLNNFMSQSRVRIAWGFKAFDQFPRNGISDPNVILTNINSNQIQCNGDEGGGIGINSVYAITGSPRASVSFAVVLVMVWLFLGYYLDNIYPRHNYVFEGRCVTNTPNIRKLIFHHKYPYLRCGLYSYLVQ